jgi:hypothetical protein
MPPPDSVSTFSQAACAPSTPPFAPSGGDLLRLGALGTVFAATDGGMAGQQNSGFGLDVVGPDGRLFRKMFVTFSTHDDHPEVEQTDAVVTSDDGATTFGAARVGVMSPPAFALRIHDGRVLSFGFVPTAVVTAGASSTLTLSAQESSDEGATWRPFSSTVTVPTLAPGAVGRLSGHPIQLADGTILLEYYGSFAAGPGRYRASLLASNDSGRTFLHRGSIAVPAEGKSYSEADVVELPDGSLYAVFRHLSVRPDAGEKLSELLWARSTDLGFTWSAPEPVLIPFGAGSAAPRVGVNPRLLLMPNGALLLSSGRNDNFVAASPTTDPVVWRSASVTYVNYPNATTERYGQDTLRVHGSSGNTGLEVLDANRAVQFGDNCANGWGCPPEDTGHTVDNKNRVWRRFIEVVTPDVGKIDLLSKFQRQLITVTTDLTWGSMAHPRARVEGAFDGSTEFWSSAVKSGGGGDFTIKLDRVYQLTRVGLSLRHGQKASASVFTSLDGITFCATPIVTAQNRTHRALEYFPLANPVSAAYVKVVLDAGSPCDAEVGTSCSFLNELELYSTIDSFENDPIGSPPRSYSGVNGGSVEMRPEGQTRRVLRLTDDSNASSAIAAWKAVPSSSKTLELSVFPLALTSAFLFDVTGKTAAGGEVQAYHFGVFPNGTLSRYDAVARTWNPMSSVGAVPLGRWSRLRVEAVLDKATVLVDGTAVGTVGPTTAGATVLDGHVFSSGGAMPVGDDVLIDDVYFR